MDNQHRKQAYAELNYAQRQVYLAIRKFIMEHGYSPTYREIGKETNITSTSQVQKYLQYLVDVDLISNDESKARTIKVLPM